MCDIAIEIQDSYITWLACKLRHMAQDILQFATYDDSSENSIEQYRKYMKDAINFVGGAHSCERLLYGAIGLDAFCAEMVNDDLRNFLIEIPYLPNELITKYGLVHENDTGDINVSNGTYTPNINIELRNENTIVNSGIDGKIEGENQEVSETVDII